MCVEWNQEKLSLKTKQILSNIFQELNSNRVQQAFDMHIALVRSTSSEVNNSLKKISSSFLKYFQVVRFIIGIKRLIQELQRLHN